MGGFTQTDLVLLALASFIAVVVLVRLMRARRDQLLVQVRDEMQREQTRKRAEEKRQQAVAKKAERKAS